MELRGKKDESSGSFSSWLHVGGQPDPPQAQGPCCGVQVQAQLSVESVPSRMKVHVPTGFAAFPCELLHVPEKWLKVKYRKLISYSYMPRGGHFAALEEPELLARDICKFVGLLERQ